MSRPVAPTEDAAAAAYSGALAEYLETRSEVMLYRASLLSQDLVAAGLGPDEIVALHAEAFEAVTARYSFRARARASSDALQFLLETMIAFGLEYQAVMEVRLRDQASASEARGAVDQRRIAEVEADASRARQRAAESERLDAEKSEVLTSVAHELRTPLTAVAGNVQLVARLTAQGQHDRVPLLLERVQDALAHLIRLTRDLLDAGRSAETPLDRAPLDLDAVARRACEWVASVAAEKGVALECAPGPELTVLGDREALQRAIGNLVANAVRYTPAGGRVTVRGIARPDEAIVEVADTGIGIAPEEHARVFEKFYRSVEARRTDSHGLGLGLALAQQLTAAHGGRIEVESAPGRGSTFRLALPRRPTDRGGPP